jgi:hypothetical protein
MAWLGFNGPGRGNPRAMADVTTPLSVLLWHVHGSWTTSLVQGPHRYLLPTLAGGGDWGRGRSRRDWPACAVERHPAELADEAVDVVVLQRPEELELTERWLGRRPGRDVPAVYVEHDAPGPSAATSRHVFSSRTDIPIVHVSHFNELMWDCGRCPTVVIPHGVVDPGERYTGVDRRAAALINEPLRRWRVAGTDLLPAFAEVAPIDVFGNGTDDVGEALPEAHGRIHGAGDLDQRTLHGEMVRRRVYLHTARWTSLGLSLVEAMHLAMPVVAVGTTEAVAAVPTEAGALSTDVTALVRSLRELMEDRDLAVCAGKCAREYALTHYGLDAFLRNWDDLLAKVVP